VEENRQRTLFQMEELEAAEERAQRCCAPTKGEDTVARPFSAAGIFLGTSSFTAAGWAGTFYPEGMKQREFLSYYATRFAAVEIDSTFYGTPAAATVTGWKEKTPADFIFAVKVPQVITHEKVLAGCEAEFDEFVERMSLLGEKLGPMLLQFPKFDKWAFSSSAEFLGRLRLFLKRAAGQVIRSWRFAVEIRNKDWLDARFADVLREHNVALALTDTSFVPRPWEIKEKLDLVTADFAYVRWLGDRKGIEERTKTWDKTIVERQSDLANWVEVFKAVMTNKKVLKIFAFANNHYAGHAPDTVKLFWNIWNGRKG
jgi:uncharacterized protein YecE (DUF72 family)